MRNASSVCLIVAVLLLAVRAMGEQDDATTEIAPPATVIEARARAILLHETIEGALQVMHRDFFDEEDSRLIPSASLEDVFEELSRQFNVKARWLIVETDAVNVDHKPQDKFEHDAVSVLASGKHRHEATEENLYRYAGAIKLHSQCLKCHVKQRSSTKERTAGLLLSMPLPLP
jgi:hypothetical protein